MTGKFNLSITNNSNSAPTPPPIVSGGGIPIYVPIIIDQSASVLNQFAGGMLLILNSCFLDFTEVTDNTAVFFIYAINTTSLPEITITITDNNRTIKGATKFEIPQFNMIQNPILINNGTIYTLPIT